ncbi:hypothetical protein [Phenylobacterium sp.]|jgi:hypothetical protein|uniref:hypothetical protein n=1 Tax=Phenylobacterium sp. TaxID=1871053 RepID=UPI00378340E9
MSADGAWKISINTPMGPQEANANITTSGDTFTGEISSALLGSQTIQGQVAGDTLTWTSDITSPMPLTLEFEAKVEGDKMSGSVKLGPFGAGALNGVRA